MHARHLIWFTHPPTQHPHSDKTSGTRILTDLVKKEGFGAFFKGLTPKLVVIGPKLVFSFTVAQQLMAYFEKW